MKKQKHPYAVLNRCVAVALGLSICINVVGTATLIAIDKSQKSSDSYYETKIALFDQRAAAADANTREVIKSSENMLLTINEYELEFERLSEENAALRKRLDVYEPEAEVLSPAPPRYFNVALDYEMQDYIWSLCCDYDISEHYGLIYAMIKKESNFDASVVSSTNDWGLMQINGVNHAWLSDELGITDFLDPYQNVRCGIYLISTVLHRYSVEDALMAYNMGESGAAKLWSQGVHTTGYTSAVLEYYKEFTENI